MKDSNRREKDLDLAPKPAVDSEVTSSVTAQTWWIRYLPILCWVINHAILGAREPAMLHCALLLAISSVGIVLTHLYEVL